MSNPARLLPCFLMMFAISGGLGCWFYKVRDPDGDGLRDERDQCPSEPEDFDGFEDADGCPEPDNDGDGILDTRDRCPLAAESVNGVEDEDGCPERR